MTFSFAPMTEQDVHLIAQLFVLPFNQRAIRVYEKVRFKRIGSYIQKSERYGEREFIEMKRSL